MILSKKYELKQISQGLQMIDENETVPRRLVQKLNKIRLLEQKCMSILRLPLNFPIKIKQIPTLKIISSPQSSEFSQLNRSFDGTTNRNPNISNYFRRRLSPRLSSYKHRSFQISNFNPDLMSGRFKHRKKKSKIAQLL